MTQVNINNKSYELESLPENVKAQLASVRYADSEIQRLQAQLAAMQTARNAYYMALTEILANEDPLSGDTIKLG